jgi:hypothetical protein
MVTPKYASAIQKARNDEITGSSKINNLRVGLMEVDGELLWCDSN